MHEEIPNREDIAKAADAAAQRSAKSGRIEANDAQPYPPGTEAARIYAAAFQRFLLLHSNPEGEGGA